MLSLTLAALLCCADVKDTPDSVKRVPPPGVKIPDGDRAELRAGADALAAKLATLTDSMLLPDVQILHKAVDGALKYDEFYNVKEVASAKALLKLGHERADQLAKGEHPWAAATGLIVRGYVSNIDGSVQPYGVVVPTERPAGGYRLDVWCHGRGETLSELSFCDQRTKQAGEFTPKGAIVLHLYGRYCCANKFAGDVDLLEAMAAVKQSYPIDARRQVIRGFSMGGAACWQFATHYPSLWCAAAPGAGFAETPEFLRVWANESVKPTWYEQKLWHLYNSTDYAANLFNVPTVAYSGEKDRQKQAADAMTKALKDEGMDLVHVIGPNTEHKYHPESKKEINAKIDAIVEKGQDAHPKKVRFTTWTLRYPESNWVRIEGMGEHWTRARLEADKEISSATIKITTENVTALTLWPGKPLPHGTTGVGSDVKIDGQIVRNGKPTRGFGYGEEHFVKSNGQWSAVKQFDESLRKQPGLQGPIDDAFMSSFLMVRPTGQAMHAAANDWARREMAHAVDHWRRQFRGEPRVKDDTQLDETDFARHNLILWGDPGSNAVLNKIAAKLPVSWTGAGVRVGDQLFPAGTHAPTLIYPNPLNPKKYIVINSGFTFREYDYLNNARQVPKLPDWAVYDVTQPTTSRHAAGVVAAGFFDEHWQLKAKQP